MKRSKLLIPTLTCLSIAPAIVSLTSCSQTSIEEEILNAVLDPADIKEKVTITDFAKAYKDENFDRKKELLYDCFGLFNLDIGDDATEKFNIHDLYVNQHEGAWRINVTKCEVEKDQNDIYYASLLGYVSYVFAKQHIAKFTDTAQRYTFNANDYIMITFDFTKVKVELDASVCGFQLNHTYGSCLGFWKYRFESGAHESLDQIEDINTSSWTVPNSKNWIQV